MFNISLGLFSLLGCSNDPVYLTKSTIYEIWIIKGKNTIKFGVYLLTIKDMEQGYMNDKLTFKWNIGNKIIDWFNICDNIDVTYGHEGKWEPWGRSMFFIHEVSKEKSNIEVWVERG